MKVKVVNKSKFSLPQYATSGSAGFDLQANIDYQYRLEPGKRLIIPTGLYMELPDGYELQVRSRSGLSIKKGIIVLNSPGTVDRDFRGEIKVILYNAGDETYMVDPGDRIAQAVITNYERAEWEEVDELSETDRGDGGFGHSGK